MSFWGTDLGSTDAKDPKRKFRWRVTIGGLQEGGIIWYAKSVTKPSFSISADTTHNYLGHKFKFPGSVTWDDINLTLVDPASPDVARKTLTMIQNAGYRFPTSSDELRTISKNTSVDAIESFTIQQLDAEGAAIETWVLHNPFINKVEFGGDLSYEDEGLSEITLGITYDWAKFYGLGEAITEGGGEGNFGYDPKK
jgi:hypothetical protein